MRSLGLYHGLGFATCMLAEGSAIALMLYNKRRSKSVAASSETVDNGAVLHAGYLVLWKPCRTVEAASDRARC